MDPSLICLSPATPDASSTETDSLSLPFDQRQKSRLRVRLVSGREAAVLTPRGSVLRGGTWLSGGEQWVRVEAAPEQVSTVRTGIPRLLTRVAYHLGNRHIPLEVGADFVRYQHDHVLDEMVRGLGAEVLFEEAPFEPEAGAYGAGHGQVGGVHDHGDGHDHGGAHAHGKAGH